LLWLASGCLLLGLLPAQIIPVLAEVVRQLGLDSLPSPAAPWWLLVPLPERQASYAPLVFFVAIVAVVALAVLLVRIFYHRRTRRAAPWDCGFARLDARMQDSAEGFGQPIRHIFQPFFAMERELPTPFDTAPHYRVSIGDRIWRGGYLPLGRLVQYLADVFARVQQGRIAVYLLYSFITLLVLLGLML
jgi:hypothetical protein